MRCLTILLSLVAVFVSRDTHATVLLDWSLEEVLARSDRVVIGVVGGKRATPDQQPLTQTEIRVERTLRGAATARVWVTQYGAQRARMRLRIPGDAELVPGERVLVALKRAADGREYLVGMSLGAYRVHGEWLNQVIEVPLLGKDGRLRAAPGDRRRTLDEVVATIGRLQ